MDFLASFARNFSLEINVLQDIPMGLHVIIGQDSMGITFPLSVSV